MCRCDEFESPHCRSTHILIALETEAGPALLTQTNETENSIEEPILQLILRRPALTRQEDKDTIQRLPLVFYPRGTSPRRWQLHGNLGLTISSGEVNGSGT